MSMGFRRHHNNDHRASRKGSKQRRSLAIMGWRLFGIRPEVEYFGKIGKKRNAILNP